MVSKIRQGEIYTAQIPFMESDVLKTRPVVIVSQPFGKYAVVAVVPLSSTTDTESVDMVIKDLDEAGLNRASTARVHRITTLLQDKLETKFGQLSRSDLANIRSHLKKYFSI